MTTMTEQNKAVIRRFIDAWNSRQPDVFDGLMASDVVRHCEATPSVEVRSLDGSRNFCGTIPGFSPILSKPSDF